jgi:hypothetical protein
MLNHKMDVKPEGVQNILIKEAFNQFSFLVHSVRAKSINRWAQCNNGWTQVGMQGHRALTENRIKGDGPLPINLEGSYKSCNV